MGKATRRGIAAAAIWPIGVAVALIVPAVLRLIPLQVMTIAAHSVLAIHIARLRVDIATTTSRGTRITILIAVVGRVQRQCLRQQEVALQFAS
jgi:hypothetical protein